MWVVQGRLKGILEKYKRPMSSSQTVKHRLSADVMNYKDINE